MLPVQGDPHTWPLFPGPSIGLLMAHSNMLTFYFALFPSDRCPKQIRPLQVFLKPFCLHFRKPFACHKLLLLFILDGALYPPASQREHHTKKISDVSTFPELFHNSYMYNSPICYYKGSRGYSLQSEGPNKHKSES